MRRRWWDGFDLGETGSPSAPLAEHIEHCPFCGQDFDWRDLGQVIEHYGHQKAAGVPAIDVAPEEDKPPGGRKVIPFDRKRTKKS